MNARENSHSDVTDRVLPAKGTLANPEIVTLAVYLLGGASKRIDTEEIAMQADKLAPSRYRWRLYPDQIDIEKVSDSLTDAAKPRHGKYILGGRSSGWMLTERGLAFAQARAVDIGMVDLSREPMTPQERQTRAHDRARLLSSEAFIKCRTLGPDAVTIKEAEAFFRLDEYVKGDARERKILRIKNRFQDDAELAPCIDSLVAKVRGG